MVEEEGVRDSRPREEGSSSDPQTCGICVHSMVLVTKILPEGATAPPADTSQEDRIINWLAKEEDQHLDGVNDAGSGAVVQPQPSDGPVLNSKPMEYATKSRPVAV